MLYSTEFKTFEFYYSCLNEHSIKNFNFRYTKERCSKKEKITTNYFLQIKVIKKRTHTFSIFLVKSLYNNFLIYSCIGGRSFLTVWNNNLQLNLHKRNIIKDNEEEEEKSWLYLQEVFLGDYNNKTHSLSWLCNDYPKT